MAGSMGRDVERIMLDQAAREAARSDQKAVWRALALAASGAAATHLGTVKGLSAVLQPASSFLKRMHLYVTANIMQCWFGVDTPMAPYRELADKCPTLAILHAHR